MKLAIATLLGLLICVSSAQAAHWSVDPSKSRLGFVAQWSGEPFAATFKTWKADITFDRSDLAHSSVLATIDLASESSETPDNDDGLKGPEGFWIDRFRFAKFKSTVIASRGNGSYLARGTLTLHGVTRTMDLPFKLTIVGRTAHAVGHAVVLRTDFGLGTGEWSGTTPIAHEVAINLDLTATTSP
jgi:polyisoprenoid-binding protein YceI